jgi:hypothetical protein
MAGFTDEVAASARRTMIARLIGDDNIFESLWDCLMDGYDKNSCKANSKGACVFCAEPEYGLCVTPSVAEKLNRYPIFDCDLAFSAGLQ